MASVHELIAQARKAKVKPKKVKPKKSEAGRDYTEWKMHIQYRPLEGCSHKVECSECGARTPEHNAVFGSPPGSMKCDGCGRWFRGVPVPKRNTKKMFGA